MRRYRLAASHIDALEKVHLVSLIFMSYVLTKWWLGLVWCIVNICWMFLLDSNMFFFGNLGWNLMEPVVFLLVGLG